MSVNLKSMKDSPVNIVFANSFTMKQRIQYMKRYIEKNASRSGSGPGRFGSSKRRTLIGTTSTKHSFEKIPAFAGMTAYS
jgi:hypothetical protein